jgi:hypothetical protein
MANARPQKKILIFLPPAPEISARSTHSKLKTSASRRADTISTVQGAELLARYDSDARTTGVVPLELGQIAGTEKYLRGVKECRVPH